MYVDVNSLKNIHILKNLKIFYLILSQILKWFSKEIAFGLCMRWIERKPDIVCDGFGRKGASDHGGNTAFWFSSF